MIELSDLKISHDDYQRISDLVYRHCGINLHDGKRPLVQARVLKRMRAVGLSSLSDYLEFVANDLSGVEFTLLIDAMSTNLTSFYREPNHFRHLADTELPALLERRRKAGSNRLRLWCAASSTGEEPYTLAMVLSDRIPDLARWDVKILATDISTGVLKTARAAWYRSERLDPLPGGYRQRFFEPVAVNEEPGFRVTKPVRDLVSFRHLNLIADWPFSGPFDVVFCRNVMIYFDKPTQEKLVNRFWNVMSDGAVLFTGHSESLTGVTHPFSYVGPTVYVKH